jgi:hypothetical protein
MIFYRDRIAVVTAAAKATTGNQPPGPGQQ